MIGYRNDPAATRAAIDGDGWLHTGDLGHVDADGYLFVTGRAKSLIVLDSGKKVAPEEVEAELARSELFTEVCVVGLRDGRRAGEQVCAVVVPAVPMSQEAAEEEVGRVTAGLSGFKRPTLVRLVDRELPTTAKHSHRRAEIVRMLEEVEASR
jgi:long-chain acyl-CoA synthetase